MSTEEPFDIGFPLADLEADQRQLFSEKPPDFVLVRRVLNPTAHAIHNGISGDVYFDTGAYLVYESIDPSIRADYRYEFWASWLTSRNNKSPSELSYSGRSDSAACAIALARSSKGWGNGPILLISARLENYNAQDHFRKSTLACVVADPTSESGQRALLRKWHATLRACEVRGTSALALVESDYDSLLTALKKDVESLHRDLGLDSSSLPMRKPDAFGLPEEVIPRLRMRKKGEALLICIRQKRLYDFSSLILEPIEAELFSTAATLSMPVAPANTLMPESPAALSTSKLPASRQRGRLRAYGASAFLLTVICVFVYFAGSSVLLDPRSDGARVASDSSAAFTAEMVEGSVARDAKQAAQDNKQIAEDVPSRTDGSVVEGTQVKLCGVTASLDLNSERPGMADETTFIGWTAAGHQYAVENQYSTKVGSSAAHMRMIEVYDSMTDLPLSRYHIQADPGASDKRAQSLHKWEEIRECFRFGSPILSTGGEWRIHVFIKHTQIEAEPVFSDGRHADDGAEMTYFWSYFPGAGMKTRRPEIKVWLEKDGERHLTFYARNPLSEVAWKAIDSDPRNMAMGEIEVHWSPTGDRFVIVLNSRGHVHDKSSEGSSWVSNSMHYMRAVGPRILMRNCGGVSEGAVLSALGVLYWGGMAVSIYDNPENRCTSSSSQIAFCEPQYKPSAEKIRELLDNIPVVSDGCPSGYESQIQISLHEGMNRFSPKAREGKKRVVAEVSDWYARRGPSPMYPFGAILKERIRKGKVTRGGPVRTGRMIAETARRKHHGVVYDRQYFLSPRHEWIVLLDSFAEFAQADEYCKESIENGVGCEVIRLFR